MGNVQSREEGAGFLNPVDIETIEYLKVQLSTMAVPKYGSLASYTKAVGLFLGTTNQERTEWVSAVSNEQGSVAQWAYEAVEERDRRHAKDAELFVMTKIEPKLNYDQAADGTLYFVQSKGPCRSCRRIIKHFFMKHYYNVRVVIYYESHENSQGMLYGIEDAVPHAGGFVARWKRRGEQLDIPDVVSF
jgi:hypothetical protein